MPSIARILAQTIFCQLIFVSTVYAQPQQSHFVYLVKASACAGRPVERALTGFRVADPSLKGIVTALHGVAGCKSIAARNDRGDVFDMLAVGAVDVEADVAVLTSQALIAAPADGLRIERAPNWQSIQTVWVFGHPFGTGNHGDRLTLRIPATRQLAEEAPSEIRMALQDRSSPSTKLTVVSLSGPLVPGHSGAPIVNSGGEVLAIANGGLQHGNVGLGWAVPYAGIILTPPAANSRRLDDIAKSDASSLFEFEVTSTPIMATVVSKTDLEKALRSVLDDAGTISWVNTAVPQYRGTTYQQRAKLISLSGCDVKIQKVRENFRDQKEELLSIDQTFTFDISKVLVSKKIAVEPEEARRTGVGQAILFQPGSPYLALESAPGFQVFRVDQISSYDPPLKNSSSGGYSTSKSQVADLPLLFTAVSAVDSAVTIFERVKESCASAK